MTNEWSEAVEFLAPVIEMESFAFTFTIEVESTARISLTGGKYSPTAFLFIRCTDENYTGVLKFVIISFTRTTIEIFKTLLNKHFN